MRLPALPDRIFTIPMLGRGIVIWGSARASLALAGWLMSARTEPLSIAITPAAAVWITLLVGVLGAIEIRRRREHLLLANLGIMQATLTVIAAVPALIGEVAVALLTVDAAARG